MTPVSEDCVVGILTEILAIECGFGSTSKQIRVAATLHDVGKQYIPAHIRDKPDRLTPDEYELMKSHTKFGHDLLCCFEGTLGEYAQTVALYHHENWANDGGYWGVPACTLPPYVGMVSLCDVLCGLVYPRVYKPAWSQEQALQYIRSKAGTQFCPKMTARLIKTVRDTDFFRRWCCDIPTQAV